MNSICIFCGSSAGVDATYAAVAYKLGKTIAEKNKTLIYGGGSIGLMGQVARGAVENGGQVIGIMPRFLNVKEVGHTELTELILVEDMHERKAKMNELSDGIIALPGGYATLEELIEMLTWGQLNLHNKPIGILNINNYYRSLIDLFDHMTEQQFLNPDHRKMLLVESEINLLLEKMNEYEPPMNNKWI